MGERTSLGTLLARRTRDGQRVRFEVTADRLQGRTTFGGLRAALADQVVAVYG